MPIGGGRKTCAHIEWPYSAVQRCLHWQAAEAETTIPNRVATARQPAAGIADTVILGTTDKVVSLDPAGAYDLGSQQLIGNMYQNLLSIPAGGTRPSRTPRRAASSRSADVHLQAQAGPEVLER